MSFVIVMLLFNALFIGGVLYYVLVMRREENDAHSVLVEEKKLLAEDTKHEEQRMRNELKEAHLHATAILSQSEHIALELISELERVVGQKNSEFKMPDANSTNFEIELGSLSEKLKEHYVTRIKKLLASLENFRFQQAQKVEEFATAQQEITGKSFQQMRSEELAKMKERIERYKEEELKLFNEKVKKVIDDAAITVLGQSLTSSEQELLINKALEKARQEGVI